MEHRVKRMLEVGGLRFQVTSYGLRVTCCRAAVRWVYWVCWVTWVHWV